MLRYKCNGRTTNPKRTQMEVRKMKKFYVEYTLNGKSGWCVLEGSRKEDVEYTLKMYGAAPIVVSEI